TGTTNYEDRGALYAAECAEGVKEAVDIPIEAQFEPPEDLSVLERVSEAGVDSLGLHLECFDQEVREEIIPGKANIPVSRYFEAFEKAVDVFGENQVSSYVIVGLGDDPQTIIDGCERLIDAGVYPFVVPFRPVVNTEMEDVPPPDSQLMWRINAEVQQMLAESSLDRTEAKAGCAKCGACSGIPGLENSDSQHQDAMPL
ncbi:MAG: radical SAM protein, partial [bacterium]